MCCHCFVFFHRLKLQCLPALGLLQSMYTKVLSFEPPCCTMYGFHLVLTSDVNTKQRHSPVVVGKEWWEAKKRCWRGPVLVQKRQQGPKHWPSPEAIRSRCKWGESLTESAEVILWIRNHADFPRKLSCRLSWRLSESYAYGTLLCHKNELQRKWCGCFCSGPESDPTQRTKH